MATTACTSGGREVPVGFAIGVGVVVVVGAVVGVAVGVAVVVVVFAVVVGVVFAIGSVVAVPCAPLLSVGINASPLAAPRTGVARYILGLLGGIDRIAAADVHARALFAPRSATASEEPPRSVAFTAFRAARAAVKLLPASYGLAQAARAVALEVERRRGLTLYHETNQAAPRFRGPVVLTVHDLSTLLFPETQPADRARHFARALRERAGEAVRVIVPTAAIARELAEHAGVEPARIRVIHHGVETRFSPDGRPAAAQRPYILCVSALDRRKGLSDLIDAYDALPAHYLRAFELALAGPRAVADTALERRLAARRPGRVRVLGFIADSALPALLRGAAAFCYPSHYEGFGLPLLEALACGVPSVASDDPALVEVAGGAALHAPRGDAAGLASALQRVLSDETLRAELRRKGPARAAIFRWEKSAELHIEVYREAAP